MEASVTCDFFFSWGKLLKKGPKQIKKASRYSYNSRQKVKNISFVIYSKQWALLHVAIEPIYQVQHFIANRKKLYLVKTEHIVRPMCRENIIVNARNQLANALKAIV